MKEKTQKGKSSQQIDKLREAIDKIDEQILRLLNRRAEYAIRIGKLKQKASSEIYIPAREEEIFERLERLNLGKFPTESIKPVFREIISACRSLERPLRIAYLGPEATFTHISARQQFGHKAEFLAEKSITDVFDRVEKGEADYGVVPVENSTEGVVSHTLDMFLNSSLKISAEVILEIHHCLLSRADSLKKIKRIYSHAQALAQCRNWLREHLPDIPILDAASTAEAAKLASKDPSSGAIASAYAGDYYGLKILARNIEDIKNNFTRFLVIGKKDSPRSGNDLTMVMFSLRDYPGVLWKALGAFASRKINLTKIESRPLKGKAWEYVFFVEMEGHIQDRKIKQALSELEKRAVFVRVLGSFPKTKKPVQEVE